MTDPAHHDRRSFLKSMGVGAGAAGAVGVAGPVLLSASPVAALPKPAAPQVQVARVALEMGKVVAPLLSAEGGWPEMEVVEDGDESPFLRKRPGRVKYGDITLRVGAGMPPPFYELVSSTLEGKPERLDGTLITYSTNLMTHSRLTFEDALITEVSFPALDGASKEACKMTVKFSPESSRFGHVIQKIPPSVTAKQKQWLCSNFRLKIDGLDCKRVTKIDAITVKQTLVESPEGTLVASKEPAKLEFPNIKFTIVDTDSDQMFKWFDSAANSDLGDERNGVITWLTSNLKSEIGELKLTNLGPVRVAHEEAGDGETATRVTMELYCEEMTFHFNTAT